MPALASLSSNNHKKIIEDFLGLNENLSSTSLSSNNWKEEDDCKFDHYKPSALKEEDQEAWQKEEEDCKVQCKKEKEDQEAK